MTNKFKFNIGILEVIVFVSGAVVLVLELLASRILAPFLGNSIFVWASLIGIILGALSVGYYLGGYFSKKNPRLAFIGWTLLAAGLLVFLITIIREPVLVVAADFGIRLGAVMATLLLFTIPSILLGMISPYALRLKVESIEESGGVAGNLYAISTVGSILGTFLAGFYLIPTFTIPQILIGLSATLVLISLIAGFGKLKLSVFLLLIVALIAITILPLPSIYLFETDSAYNHIRVADVVDKKTNRLVRILFLATETHSLIYKDSDELVTQYHQLYHLDNLFKPEIKKALTLGGGAYVGPLDFLKRYPDAEMTVVEIDPEVTQVAKDYFRLTDDPRLTIKHEDARIFLNQSKEKFDIIYGDTFASYYSVPFHLTTQEALEKMAGMLEDNGILVLNIISSLEGDKSQFLKAEYKTLKEIFPQIYLLPDRYYNEEHDATKPQNIIVFATKNPDGLKLEQLLAAANDEQKELLDHLWQKEIKLDQKTKKLTDDFAPVDFYIAQFL